MNVYLDLVASAESILHCSNAFCIVAGYAVSVGERNNAVVYFAGAPRSEHVGQVVLFKKDGMNWTVAQKIRGNQVSHSTFIKH